MRTPESPEEFYVLSEAAVAEPQSLQRHKDQLLVAEPVRATLARQRRVFRPSPMASQFDLPGDFFNLTAEEIKREQRLRSEAVERLSVLRTKAMREREEQRELRKYTYTLLRVRLPDGCLLQGGCPWGPALWWGGSGGLPGSGCSVDCSPTDRAAHPGTFYARERVGALYAFVREALQSDWLPFDLLASGGQKLSEEDSLAFNECGLVSDGLPGRPLSSLGAVRAGGRGPGFQSHLTLFV